MLMSVYDILIMNNHSDKIKGIHMKKTKEQHNERKKEIMEKCFECYAENGLTGTGIKALPQPATAPQAICIVTLKI